MITDHEHNDTYTIYSLITHHTSVLYFGEYVSCSSRPSPTSVGRVAIEAKSGISQHILNNMTLKTLFN